MRARFQWLVPVLAFFPGVTGDAEADVPRGTYTMKADGGLRQAISSSKLLPFFGPAAASYLKSERLQIDLGAGIRVNGDDWTFVGESAGFALARMPQSEPRVRIEVWFSRDHGVAKASLSYAELDALGGSVCETTRPYVGTHAP